jgi:hypothetical protein
MFVVVEKCLSAYANFCRKNRLRNIKGKHIRARVPIVPSAQIWDFDLDVVTLSNCLESTDKSINGPKSRI